MIVLGVMTVTSCDGLDAVCIEFSTAGDPSSEWPDWKILWHQSVSYPKALREKILRLQLPNQKITIKDLLATDRALGCWYGDTIVKLLNGKNKTHPHVVANHGQTVAHFPADGTTLQLGDPTQIAQKTGLTVVSHFREGDLASGGEGAPLLPLFHRILATKFSEFSSGVAIHNLGGISNFTYIHPTDPSQTIAFDTGPSNIWIDEAVSIATRGKKSYDAQGMLGRKGSPDVAAVKRLLQKPYFKKAPPKSTGRDDFPFSMLKSATRARGNDLIATATLVTSESIAQAYEKFILKKGLPLKTIYCAGGGAKNELLLDLLSTRLAPIQIKVLSDASIENLTEQTLEGSGFALFGYLSLLGKPLGGAWTGAESFASPGWITPGQNWKTVASLVSKLLK
jgi:anhydro-N-acetylmuramic acid kinase